MSAHSVGVAFAVLAFGATVAGSSLAVAGSEFAIAPCVLACMFAAFSLAFLRSVPA